MKKFKAIFVFIVCVAMFSGIATAHDKGDVGLEAGMAFQQHRNPTLKTAVMNFFRLHLIAKPKPKPKHNRKVYYFIHKEIGNFTVDAGDADGRKDATAFGLNVDFGALNLDFMIGRARTNVDGNIGFGGAWRAAPNADIRDADSEDTFAELGVNCKYAKNNASLNIGVSYRHHPLKEEIQISDSSAAIVTDTIEDLNSINLTVAVSYMF